MTDRGVDMGEEPTPSEVAARWAAWKQHDAELRKSRLEPREEMLMDVLWAAFEMWLDLVHVPAHVGGSAEMEVKVRLAQSVVAELVGRGWVEVRRGHWAPLDAQERVAPAEIPLILDDYERWVWRGPESDDGCIFLVSTDLGMAAYRALEEKVWGAEDGES